MIYGLIAAIGWGASAIAATNAARRAGTYIAVLARSRFRTAASLKGGGRRFDPAPDHKSTER